jgi:alanine racemase
MNRCGFRYDNLRATLPEVLGNPNLVFDAVYTHFATAEEPGDPFFAAQQCRFDDAWREIRALGLGSASRHAANSAAMLRDRGTWYDAVRPGLLLFGVVPPPLTAPGALCLKPVMSLRSRVVTVKGMRVGETSGYGARFTARRPTQVAVVPAGYADGLDVRLAGAGFALVRGRRAPIVGSVCMDSITVDVTDLDVSPGDEVVVIGAQGDDQISAAEVATEIGTVPHEILCRTGSRIERVYTREIA